MTAFQQVINVLANVLSVLTFMSPIPSLYRSWRVRDLGELSFLPFACMLVNSFVWLTYGLLSGSYFPLFSTMAVCELLCIAYIGVYLSLSTQKKRSLQLLAVAVGFMLLVCVYMALGLSGVTNQSRESTTTVVGVIADAGSLAMYASPFETIVRVVKTKDARSMPIHLSFVGAVGNLVWVVYAVLADDIIVLIPNVVCSTIGWIQVVVWWVYRPGKAIGGGIEDLKTQGAVLSPIVGVKVAIETPEANGAFAAAKSPQQVV